MRISDWSSDVCSSDLHQRLLIDELNHRVKNTLAIVQAMAQQTFKGDARLRAASEVFQGRLSALSTAHNILVRDRWSPASLTQIVRDVVKPHRGADERVRIAGPDVTIPDRKSVVSGKSVSVRVDLGGRRIIKTQKKQTTN